jgi:hypothetical protein
MSKRNKQPQEEWLVDVNARQRNIVFPDTVENEARFWRNVGKQPFTATTKVGLALLALLGWGLLIRFSIWMYQEGTFWAIVSAMALFWGPIFGALAWATRRTLRRIQNSHHKR